MARKSGLQPIKVFWPNVGSIGDYQQSTADILQRIKQFSPTRRDAIGWICDEYGVVPEFARKLLNVLGAVGVVRSDDSRYLITTPGEQFLKTGDAAILFRLISRRVIGFRQMLEVVELHAPISIRTWRKSGRKG